MKLQHRENWQVRFDGYNFWVWCKPSNKGGWILGNVKAHDTRIDAYRTIIWSIINVKSDLKRVNNYH